MYKQLLQYHYTDGVTAKVPQADLEELRVDEYM
jgi:hypothetical protein